MKFVYVILHYKTEEDTAACVRSIFASDSESEVVIVDNCSGNGSMEKVEETFSGMPRVHFLRNEENLGFAAGNNRGYAYARDVLHADFIAVSNNDIVVDTGQFPARVLELYDREPFHVMGPDIVSAVDGGHQNPAEESFRTAFQVRKEILRYRFLLFLSRSGIYDLMKKNRAVRTGSSKREIPETVTDSVMLHGSFVVFSKDFVSREQTCFREGTFLYVEEAILKRYCDSRGYRTVFDPSLRVCHKEDSATQALRLTNRERREFVYRNMIRSLSVYLEYFR